MSSILVPSVASFFYAILFLALTAAKKNRMLYIFMSMICAFLFWTIGSVMMRASMYPGVIFWCKLSIFGMFAIPVLYYEFISEFINDKGFLKRKVFTVLLGVSWILLLSDQLLTDPRVVLSANGYATFEYGTSIWMLVPVLYVLWVAIGILKKIFQSIKAKEQSASDFWPVIAGVLVLTTGTLLSAIPAIGRYPVDTLSGIINALCLFYTLYKRRLIKMTMVISRGTTYVLTCCVVMIFSANFINPTEQFLYRAFPSWGPYIVTIVVILFSLMTCLVFYTIKWFIDLLFVKEDQKKAELLRSYSAQIASHLDLNLVCKELINVIADDIDVRTITICLKNDKETSYHSVYSSQVLQGDPLTISSDNPCITYLLQTKKSVAMKEFKRSIWYKSMWKNEKDALEGMKIDCLVPLLCENDLVGLIALSQKQKAYSLHELTFLDSIASISALAIKNAYLYQKIYEKASSDHLTNLLNREFFFQEMESIFLQEPESMILALLNVDDFALYNELYGRSQGDIALQSIASIIASSLKDEQTVVARYAGKEFAILFVNSDLLHAKRKISMILEQIHTQNQLDSDKWKKDITMSVGLCVYPYASSSMRELVSNTEMAVFNAKNHGKNRIVVYTMEEISGKSEQVIEDNSAIYQQYAPTISALTAAIDVKDRYTFHHSENVANYATALAKALGLNKEHIELIKEAALLHDVGKIGIPEDILNKPGRLTDDEYRLVQTHVENSISIIRHLPSLDYVIPAVLGHHERWDGKGYPRGLKKDENPIAARCICVADTFDAMTTKRSYRDPLPLQTAIDEIKKGANTQFDPKLSKLFVELVESGKIIVPGYEEQAGNNKIYAA